MNSNIKEEAKSPKRRKPPKEKAPPLEAPARPMLTAAVVFVLCLAALITDCFIYPLGAGLLAPVILQIIILAIPAYLCVMLTYPDRSVFLQMRAVGFRILRAEYIFFLIFSAFFTICGSLALTLSFGGAFDLSGGMTLLGIFAAGENEFAVSAPYLILTYAVMPAILEEFLFRGVIFSQLERISFPFAALVSTVLYALSGFTLGGVIPSLFVGIMLVFVYYTTRSLWACVIMHFLFNLYKLFLEANICAYFLSSANDMLLLITVALGLLVSAILFFSESARIFRARAAKVAEKKQRSASKLVNIRSALGELRCMLAYKPSLVLACICLAVFSATVIINYLV